MQFFVIVFIEEYYYQEEDKIGDCFIKLCWMLWLYVYLFENECLGYIGYFIYDFGIYQIGKVNEICCNRSGYGNYIYYIYIIYFCFVVIELERNDQFEGIFMIGQFFIICEFLFIFWKKFNWKYYFLKMIQVIFWIIEQVMFQLCFDQDVEKIVKEKWFEFFFVYFFIMILIVYYYVSKEYFDSL